MITDETNRELLIGFIDESMDSLIAVDNLFVKLETAPHDLEIVNAVFRPIHSLKGNAAYFGLMRIKKLAHSMENLLDLVRKGRRNVDRSVIDALLPGMDSLRAMLSNVRNGEAELADDKPLQEILSRINDVIGNAAGGGRAEGIAQVIDQLRGQVSSGGKDSLEKLIAMLSTIPDFANINKGNVAAPTEHKTEVQLPSIAGQLYAVLSQAGSIAKNSDQENIVSEMLAKLRGEHSADSSIGLVREISDVFDVFTRTDAGLDGLAISMMLEKLATMKPVADNGESVSDAAKKTDLPAAKDSVEHKTQHDKTMRIPEQSLDDFLRCVGELLGIEEMLHHVSRQISSGADSHALSIGIKNAVGQFESISKELRTKIMEVRKVEARSLLQKTPRIVRDIAAQSGKKINVICVGENLKIDKSYIDLLDAPLTHMVRNAADHGIESTAARVSAGKPETGAITVSMLETSDDLQLTVSDDGAGLDYDGLQRKAVALGLIAENARLTQNDVVELLFQSGVSTAKVVTDVSGRGVGMDVVKRAIVEAGGKIEVTSDKGTGSKFIVSVPRNASTQILDGYMVRSFQDGIYVLPLNVVVEAFAILPHEITGIAGKGKVLNRRGKVVALHDLDALLGQRVNIFENGPEVQMMGVIVTIKGKSTALAVREIVGIQKVVCKQLEGVEIDKEIFDGAAISGTGHVSMIVNVERLLAFQ